MKRLNILFSFLLITTFGFSQVGANIEVFSEDGEPFTLIVNGMKVNESPQTNVKLNDLDGIQAKLKVIFADAGLGSVDKGVMIGAGVNTKYNVKKDKKGRFVIKLASYEERPQAPAPAPVAVQRAAPAPAQSTTVVQETTTINAAVPGVSMGVNVNGMNMSVTGTGLPTHAATVTTTTTTTSGGNTAAPAPPSPVPGYNGPIGCNYPMAPADFSQALQSLEGKTFDSAQLPMAKQIASSNCFTADQVKQIVKIFDHKSSRVEFAKFAYDHTYDLGNYFKVNDAFTFDSETQELADYLRGR